MYIYVSMQIFLFVALYFAFLISLRYAFLHFIINSSEALTHFVILERRQSKRVEISPYINKYMRVVMLISLQRELAQRQQ